jgi:hypothetical protein
MNERFAIGIDMPLGKTQSVDMKVISEEEVAKR